MKIGERSQPLRPGDVVEVRPPAEILATLDDEASLAEMPFMAEMIRHVGKRFHVAQRVEKICDPGASEPVRRMRDTVFLEDLRCDGAAHDGCQAQCRLYWREEWLRPVEGGQEQTTSSSPEDLARLERLTQAGGRTVRDADGDRVDAYRCQATQAAAASEVLGRYDVRQYVREVQSGNVTVPHLVRVLAKAFWMKFLRTVRVRGDLALQNMGARVSRQPLGLRVGERVQVRPAAEISATLDANGMNRGLLFDVEMLPHCGRTYRVQDRIERFIDEHTGKMVRLESDCLVLEGVVCTGECGVWKWFCRREIYPYWREAWLRRVDEPVPQAPTEIPLAESLESQA